MLATRIVEAIDVTEDHQLGGPAGWPGMTPDQLGLDRLEERFDRRVIITVSFPAHRYRGRLSHRRSHCCRSLVLTDLHWGDVHKATHDHPVLGRLPVIGQFLNIHQSTGGGDNTLLRGLTRGTGDEPLAYGTSSRTMANTGYDFPVDPAKSPCTGLNRPTRFVCARRLVVSLENKAFSIGREAGTPVIGRPDGADFDRMNDVRARIAAEADMAAEKCELRRRGRSPVTVEYRRTRRVRPGNWSKTTCPMVRRGSV